MSESVTEMTVVPDVPCSCRSRTRLTAQYANLPNRWRECLRERRRHTCEWRQQWRRSRTSTAVAASSGPRGVTCQRTLMRQIWTNSVALCFERRPRGQVRRARWGTTTIARMSWRMTARTGCLRLRKCCRGERDHRWTCSCSSASLSLLSLCPTQRICLCPSVCFCNGRVRRIF